MSDDIEAAANGGNEGVLTLTMVSGTVNHRESGAGVIAVVTGLRLMEQDNTTNRAKVGGPGVLLVSDRTAGDQPFAVAESIPVRVIVEEIPPSPMWGNAVAKVTITSLEPEAKGASSSALLGVVVVPDMRKKIPVEPAPVLYSGAAPAPWFVWDRRDVAQYTVSLRSAPHL